MASEIFILIGVVWILGFLKEMAYIDKHQNLVEKPENLSWGILILVVFFTWPYLYFYGKAGKK